MKSAVKQKDTSTTPVAVNTSTALLGACLSLILLAGCASRGNEVASAQIPEELQREDNPFARTDPKVLYYVGAAEISGRRDQQQAAAEYYAKAAALSDDPRLSLIHI